jgi:hypothetical protein
MITKVLALLVQGLKLDYPTLTIGQIAFLFERSPEEIQAAFRLQIDQNVATVGAPIIGRMRGHAGYRLFQVLALWKFPKISLQAMQHLTKLSAQKVDEALEDIELTREELDSSIKIFRSEFDPSAIPEFRHAFQTAFLKIVYENVNHDLETLKSYAAAAAVPGDLNENVILSELNITFPVLERAKSGSHLNWDKWKPNEREFVVDFLSKYAHWFSIEKLIQVFGLGRSKASELIGKHAQPRSKALPLPVIR